MKIDNSLFDEKGNIKSDVFFGCYEKAIIELYGSLENYEKYLNKKEIEISSLASKNFPT